MAEQGDSQQVLCKTNKLAKYSPVRDEKKDGDLISTMLMKKVCCCLDRTPFPMGEIT